MFFKGQIGFMETIMVTLVVVIMLGLGMFFYFRFYGATILDTGEELRDQENTILLATLSSLPEIQCSVRTVDKPCLDAIKLFAMTRLTQDLKVHYIPLFGKKVIKVKQFFPSVRDEECTVSSFQQADYPGNCNEWIIYSNPDQSATKKEILSTPISLYYPTREEYAVAKLIIEVYS